MSWHTIRETEPPREGSGEAVPGAVLVWSGDTPTLLPLRLPTTGLVLGRELLGSQSTDDRISRQHARIRFVDGRFAVEDLESRNGTYAAATRISGEVRLDPPCVLRTGRTVSLLTADLRPFEGASVELRDEVVIGPILADAWRAVARAARSGSTLLLTGESGTGKELAARVFHESAAEASGGGAGSPLIAVNCAAIPAGVAERLLFGARKGAFSGADRDAEGYLAAASGGTLFLDEIADLDLQVQTKLLRVLETGELLPLGAARPHPVSVRVVAATLKDLGAEVVAGRFREDLFYRIGRPEVRIPPLRQRGEEIPWLVWREVQKVSATLAVHPSLIEACMVRPWPGNVREMLREVRRAAHEVLDEARDQVRSEDLDQRAGFSLGGAASGVAHLAAAALAGGAEALRDGAPSTVPGTAKRKLAAVPDGATVERALREHGGNVTRAARALGLHRNQLRRWLSRNPDAAALVGAVDPADDAAGDLIGDLADDD